MFHFPAGMKKSHLLANVFVWPSQSRRRCATVLHLRASIVARILETAVYRETILASLFFRFKKLPLKNRQTGTQRETEGGMERRQRKSAGAIMKLL